MRQVPHELVERAVASSPNPCAEVPLGTPPVPFQSTTRRGLAADATSIMGPYRPGALVSQGRYVDPLDRPELDDGTMPYETRLGLVVGLHGTGMDDQVDVVWSAWAPSSAPRVLAARRRIRQAASAHSANEGPVGIR